MVEQDSHPGPHSARKQKGPTKGAFLFSGGEGGIDSDRLGPILTLRASRLRRYVANCCAIGRTQCHQIHHPHPVNKKEATRASFLFTGGGASLARRMLRGALPQFPVPLIRTDSLGRTDCTRTTLFGFPGLVGPPQMQYRQLSLRTPNQCNSPTHNADRIWWHPTRYPNMRKAEYST